MKQISALESKEVIGVHVEQVKLHLLFYVRLFWTSSKDLIYLQFNFLTSRSWSNIKNWKRVYDFSCLHKHKTEKT